MKKVVKTDEEWRKQLTKEQYEVARGKGTEPAFCGAFYDNKKPGIYSCVCCGLPLFSSQAKFDSGTGWPSFLRAACRGENVVTKEDLSHGMQPHRNSLRPLRRASGTCLQRRAAADGLRYCLNSVSLVFTPQEHAAAGRACKARGRRPPSPRAVSGAWRPRSGASKA